MSGAAAQASGFVPSILMIGWQSDVAWVPVLDDLVVWDVGPGHDHDTVVWYVIVEYSPWLAHPVTYGPFEVVEEGGAVQLAVHTPLTSVSPLGHVVVVGAWQVPLTNVSPLGQVHTPLDTVPPLQVGGGLLHAALHVVGSHVFCVLTRPPHELYLPWMLKSQVFEHLINLYV